LDNLLLWLSLGVVILFFTAPLTVGAIGGVFLLAVVLYNKAYFEKNFGSGKGCEILS